MGCIPKDGVDRRSVVKSSITLPVTLRDGKHTIAEYVQFYVVDYPMACNAIFRQSVIRMEKMVVTMFCMKIKFSKKTIVGFLCLD